MLKNILVCTDGSAGSDVAIDYACHLGKRLNGRLTALHVLDSRVLEGPVMADVSNWIGAQPYGAQVHHFVKLLEEKGRTILESASARAQAAGMPMETMMQTGHPVRVILSVEARAELLVLGRRGEHAEWTDEPAGASVERIVRRSAKPCLVTPGAFAPITRVLAAYDGSSHSSKALHEATEMAKALAVNLVVAVAVEGIDRAEADRLAAEAMAMCKPHGIDASSVVQPGRASRVIVEAATSGACDLIVMGAYGHSRIRDMILGSNTNEVLLRADVPLLLVR